MGDGFATVLGRQFLVWSGWVFTVGGAIGSFVLGGGYSWIGWLLVLTGLLALTGHSHASHQGMKVARAERDQAVEQTREAERRLSDVSVDVLNRIRALVTPLPLTEVAARLAAHADYVIRAVRFVAAAGEVHLRTFVHRGDVLHAAARIPGAALAHLREKDPFVLVRSSEGLRTDCALIVVHQTPDPTHEVAYFRVVQALSDDTRALEQLAAVREVSGLTGYTLRPACDPGWYAALESATIPEAIIRIAQGLERERGAGA